jgi:hypothetical protein
MNTNSKRDGPQAPSPQERAAARVEQSVGRKFAKRMAEHDAAAEHAYEQRLAEQRARSQAKRRPHTRQSR